eukprot:Rmarinus@m.9649
MAVLFRLSGTRNPVFVWNALTGQRTYSARTGASVRRVPRATMRTRTRAPSVLRESISPTMGHWSATHAQQTLSHKKAQKRLNNARVRPSTTPSITCPGWSAHHVSLGLCAMVGRSHHGPKTTTSPFLR